MGTILGSFASSPDLTRSLVYRACGGCASTAGTRRQQVWPTPFSLLHPGPFPSLGDALLRPSLSRENYRTRLNPCKSSRPRWCQICRMCGKMREKEGARFKKTARTLPGTEPRRGSVARSAGRRLVVIGCLYRLPVGLANYPRLLTPTANERPGACLRCPPCGPSRADSETRARVIQSAFTGDSVGAPRSAWRRRAMMPC
jgi:hypothetical protein